jgi:type I restriction enzyme S subunit
MIFQKYESYKDSGVKWLEEIPFEWDVITMKNIFRYFGSGSTPLSNNIKYYEDGYNNWLNTSDLKNFYIHDTKFKITDLALKEIGLKVYPINTIAVAMYGQGETRGTPALLKIPTTTNQASCMMYKTFLSDERYILWWFISKKESLRAINVGATQPNMNADFIKNLFISLPKKHTQIKIANYLDIKTKKIDDEITLLEQKIKKYQELKQTLINETVLRGVDKSVELKDSGIEWIGDIPKSWEVKRVKDIFDVERGRPIAQTELIDEGLYPVYSSQTENNGCLGYINSYDYDITCLTWTTDGVNAGTVFLRNGKFNCTNICGILKLKYKIDSLKYLLYSVQSSTKHNKRIDTNGAKIMSNEMKIIPIVLPSKEEQIKIAFYLDEKTTKIDTITKTIKDKIDVLKEFRKTLINDVVTGKVKVEYEL